MNDKQNALEIINFGKPDHVARHIPCYNVSYNGANHQGFEDLGMEDGHDRPVGAKWYDIWNTQWHKEYPGIMGFPKGNPLAEPSALSGYEWPDPDDSRICSKIYDEAKQFRDSESQFLTGSHRDTLWEKAYMLVGMENMMEYFFTEPDYVKEVLHKIMDFQLGIALHYEKIGVEMVSFGDDMGTQSGLLLGEKIFYEFLFPEYKRLFDFYKSRDILINFHSCGHIEPLLGSFIELGVNILNPVQATANNFKKVVAVTQGKMALSGGISTDLIMNGSEEEIRKNVKETIALLGKNGGYFCAPDQYLPFPAEKVEMFERAVEEFGKYPL